MIVSELSSLLYLSLLMGSLASVQVHFLTQDRLSGQRESQLRKCLSIRLACEQICGGIFLINK